MSDKVFCGPGEFVFPAYLDPRGGGTLVAQPGEAYDFGNEDPPGPAEWWADAPPAPKQAAKPVNPAPAAPADAPATGQEG